MFIHLCGWRELLVGLVSMRGVGVVPASFEKTIGCGERDLTPVPSPQDYKLRVLEESDPGLISTLQHRLSDQRVELETRTHAISAIQRNFENLSKVYQREFFLLLSPLWALQVECTTLGRFANPHCSHDHCNTCGREQGENSRLGADGGLSAREDCSTGETALGRQGGTQGLLGTKCHAGQRKVRDVPSKRIGVSGEHFQR